eukprot:gene12587-14875_t
MLGLVTNLLEDVPQAVILVFANSLTGTWSGTATVSFVATVLAICYGITKRMLSSILVFTIGAQAYLQSGGVEAAAADAAAPSVPRSAGEIRVQMPELMKEAKHSAVNPEGQERDSTHRTEIHSSNAPSIEGAYTEYNNPLAHLDQGGDAKIMEIGVHGQLSGIEGGSFEVLNEENGQAKNSLISTCQANSISDSLDGSTSQQVASSAAISEGTNVVRSLSA